MSSGFPVPFDCSPVRVWELPNLVRAGFPSPAEDLGAKRIDVLERLVIHPQATFTMGVRGDSMIEFKIFDGDVILVDRAIKERHGHIVVAVLDNEFLIKQLYKRGSVIKLKSGNPTFPDIVPKEGQTLSIWGVVITSITRFAY